MIEIIKQIMGLKNTTGMNNSLKRINNRFEHTEDRIIKFEDRLIEKENFFKE